MDKETQESPTRKGATLRIDRAAASPAADRDANPAAVISEARVDAGLEGELADLIVESLNLEVAPGAIDPEATLYGEGLGLDSIDILEIALAVSKKYGFALRSDDENNQDIFKSLRSLGRHIAAHRTR